MLPILLAHYYPYDMKTHFIVCSTALMALLWSYDCRFRATKHETIILTKRRVFSRAIQKVKRRVLPAYTSNPEHPEYKGNWTQIGVFTSYFWCGGAIFHQLWSFPGWNTLSGRNKFQELFYASRNDRVSQHEQRPRCTTQYLSAPGPPTTYATKTGAFFYYFTVEVEHCIVQFHN